MINKFICLHLSLFVVAVVAAQEKPFTINGSIKGTTNGYVYLYYGQHNTLDSSLIENGHFSFKGKLDGPSQAMVAMDRNSRMYDKYAQLYLSPGKMQLSLDYNNFSDGVVLKGSKVQQEADILKKMQAPVMEEMKPLSQAYDKAGEIYRNAIKAKKDEATLQQLKDQAENAKEAMEPYQKQLSKIDDSFMDKYPSSYVTASMMRYRINEMQLSEAEERYNKLPSQIKNSALGKEIKNEVESLRMGSPGSKAYVFASKELRGEPLSLADYKGKYVLLDFWASWCVPCRRSNPHLKELYSKYKDKGFEIIGISDDDNNHEAWQKAVEKDQIAIWKHVLRGLDMKKRMAGEKNETDISQYYGIHTLPTKILIDPNGVIIGRYGGGGEDEAAMDKKLSEVFGG